MPKIVSTENQRDINNGAVVVAGGFSQGVRSLELNSLNDGDIVTIPAPGFQVLSRKIRGSENTFEYVNVDVERNGNPTVGQLTPGIFWRNLEVADANGNGTGDRKVASGDVVDAVQNYADLNQFFADNAGKKFKVTYGPQFMAVGFNGGPARKARVATLSWVN